MTWKRRKGESAGSNEPTETYVAYPAEANRYTAPMIHLRGHSALITGSTKGVGRSIALAFAEAGANVVLHVLPFTEH